MFNMRQIGSKLVELRKNSNMTQTELADRLGISFQAVSNWERGNSMPDISKLPELAEIFNISIDEFIGGQSKLIESAIKDEVAEYIENHELSEEEVREVAPILKPSQIEEITENANIMDFEDISFLLPFMTEDDVREFALKAQENGRSTNAFLPFMAEDDVRELALKVEEKGESTKMFLPFMAEEDVRELAFKAQEKGEAVNAFLPFMAEDGVRELAFKAEEKGEALNAFLPFIAADGVKEFAFKAQEKGETIKPFLPFMAEDDVRELAFKAEEKGEPLNEFLPFMEESDIKKIALNILNRRNQK